MAAGKFVKAAGQLLRILGERCAIAEWRLRIAPFIASARPLALSQFQADLKNATAFLPAPLHVRL